MGADRHKYSGNTIINLLNLSCCWLLGHRFIYIYIYINKCVYYCPFGDRIVNVYKCVYCPSPFGGRINNVVLPLVKLKVY